MKKVRLKLSHQLLILVGVTFVLLFTSLGVIIPRVLAPFLETNIYNYLKEPLQIMDDNVDKLLLDTEVAYIYVLNNKTVTSDNLDDIIKNIDKEELLNKFTNTYGKFLFNHKTYYYYTIKTGEVKKIALTNNNYIEKTKNGLISIVFPIVFGTFLIIGLILVLWSSTLVRKIVRLKEKIDNIDNSDYNHNIDFESDDELQSLAFAIEDMRVSLLNQEEFRNQMYQNISHDFKTPLTVIKSYVEAVEDGVEDEQTALSVIKEQTKKLELKVHSLLYLNKLDYLKDCKNVKLELIDIKKIITEEVQKFKFTRKDINFIVDVDPKAKYYGTLEHWETVFDNILGNFMRYTHTTIKITARKNSLILYNDGDNIDEKFLDGIFTPFRRGIKGEFGLGLSIVEKTLKIMHYDIVIRNEKKGVSFIISKETHL